MTMDKQRFPVQATQRVIGVFAPFRFDGTNDPSILDGGNALLSVERTDVGLYTIHAKPQYQGAQGMCGISCQAVAEGAAETNITVVVPDPPTGDYDIAVFSGGVLTDPAAGSAFGNWCYTTLWLKYTTAEDGVGF